MRITPIWLSAMALAVAIAASPATASPETPWKTQSFRSEPLLHPPVVQFSGRNPDPGAGDIFADAQSWTQTGPLILNPWGRLIYFRPIGHAAPLAHGQVGALDVKVQSYQGQTVLTYWQGKVIRPGVGIGRGVILDHHYQTVAEVHAGHGYHADLHEFQITPEGTALITAYARVKANLRPVGGPRNGKLLDSIAQEIDIATGRVLWEWHAHSHVHLRDSYAKPTRKPYDFFHINAIQKLPNGNLLISGRHTWTVYEIDRKTGRVRWKLGGKHSNFKIGRGAHFAWQHDARLNGATLTVFDNGAGLYKSERRSRALQIHLNFRTHRAKLKHAYINRPHVLASSQGAMQSLPDGNVFVGWGSVPRFTEFSKAGRQLFSMVLPSPLMSYRAYRFPWWGQPTTPPSIALAATSSGTNVYASWNGATGVASWRVLAGPDPGALSPVGQPFPNTFFETTMAVESTQPYFAVQALGHNGEVLGTSTVAGPLSTSRLAAASASGVAHLLQFRELDRLERGTGLAAAG
jgi:hypothetical protein